MNSCVYVLAKAGKPIYVGNSTNLDGRLKEHAWRKYDAVWHQEVSPADRRSLEAKVIEILRPPMNYNHNPDVHQSVGGSIYPLRIEVAQMDQVADLAKQRQWTKAHVIRNAITEYLRRRAS